MEISILMCGTWELPGYNPKMLNNDFLEPHTGDISQGNAHHREKQKPYHLVAPGIEKSCVKLTHSIYPGFAFGFRPILGASCI